MVIHKYCRCLYHSFNLQDAFYVSFFYFLMQSRLFALAWRWLGLACLGFVVAVAVDFITADFVDMHACFFSRLLSLDLIKS